MRIVVTGGTGFVGRQLLPNLQGRGHGVVVASRDPQAARTRLPPGTATCALSGEDLQRSLRGSGAVVHLAGDPVVEGRWTEEKKRRIRDSRVETTRRLVEDLAAVPPAERPGILVAASAIGWYGDTGETERDETAPPGSDFLAGVCREWEEAARGAEALGLRVVIVRLGVVLGRGGGALAAMEAPFRAFVGAPLGPGTNWMSWIHAEDLVALIGFALERHDVRGPVNGVAPHAARQIEICRGLARRLRRPCWPGIPRPLVRLMFGEKANVLLSSQRIVPAIPLRLDFAWRFPTLDAALDDLYPR